MAQALIHDVTLSVESRRSRQTKTKSVCIKVHDYRGLLGGGYDLTRFQAATLAVQIIESLAAIDADHARLTIERAIDSLAAPKND